MKTAIISDVHGNMPALEKVLEDAKQQGVSQYIVLGDIIMVGPEPLAVFQTIKSLKPVAWIKGNTDLWLEEMGEKNEFQTPKELELYEYYSYAKEKFSEPDLEFMKALPTEKTVTIEGHEILCVHGSPRSITEIMDGRIPAEELEERVRGASQPIILCGHSHVPYIGVAGGKRIVNAGSVGRPLDGNTWASYGLMDVDAEGNVQFSIRRVSYPVQETLETARKNHFPNMERYEKELTSASPA